MKKPLNIAAIHKYVEETHKDFMDRYGQVVDKVQADHKLRTDIVFAGLLPIFVCFRETKVIDDFETKQEGYNKSTKLSKIGHDGYVMILTNGVQILIESRIDTDNLMHSDLLTSSKLFSDVHSEEFDWEVFSRDLLDYVHRSIYERKTVTEVKIEGLLRAHD